MAKHDVCWVEWATTDMDRAKGFLSGLFEDWQWETFGDGFMYIFSPPGGGLSGGIYKSESVQPGSSPAIYIEVEDIDPYVAKAKELGGSLAMDKMEIPGGIGWSAALTDHDGNHVGLYQPNPGT